MRRKINDSAAFFHILLFILFLIIIFVPLSCLSEDKNGVSPTTVSLPSGPGSIEGLGAAYQPMLNTGSARYAVPISLPKGIAGNTPSLSLRYESGRGDGPIGLGWSFGPGGIARQTDKGIPRYVDSGNGIDDNYNGIVDDYAELDRFLGLNGEELVEVEPGIYRPRIEGSFVRYRRVNDSWQADLKNGTTLEFGTSENARIIDSTGQKVFKWMLQKSTDANGNAIEYFYSDLTGSENNAYLREIRYGPGISPWSTHYFIRFSYELKSDWRKDYRSGFLVKTAHRLRQIDIGIQGTLPDLCLEGDWNEDTIPDALISRYVLEYGEASPVASQLVKVTRFGSDGVNYLPPISFSYSNSDQSTTISARDAMVNGQNSPPIVMDNELVELVDLNRDGLADILQTDFTGSHHLGYLNLGIDNQAASPTLVWAGPITVESDDDLARQLHLSENQVNLADIDGDGLADLVHTSETNEVFYHANRGDLSWGPRARMAIGDTAPPAPSSSKNIIVADLDFNKRIDVFQSTDNGYAIWFNQDSGLYSQKVVKTGAIHNGQVLLFSEPGVRTGDINGDRLTDVVKITPGELIYCASLGHGNYADSVSIPIPEMMLTDGDNGQISRAKLTDLNGDGLDDLVVERAENDQLWFWLNLGTDTLTRRYIVTGMPVTYGTDAEVRWADMNGNGTTDLIYADSSASNRLQVIDLGQLLDGDTLPHLLKTIQNGLGVTTTLIYRSSTSYYLQAAWDATPWSSTIPFPVQVVAETRVTTGLDLDITSGPDEYVKQFYYRDGYYEDREKQFRGFAHVTVTEPGDESAPTRITRHEFHTGGPDMVDNDDDNTVDEITSKNHREEDALKGMVLAVQAETETGEIFNRSENNWAVKTLLTGGDNVEVRFAYKTLSETIISELTESPETIRSTFVHDDYGNITEQRNEGVLSIAGDEQFSFTEYINDTTNWLLGLPGRAYITDSNLQMAAETLYYYDGAPFTGLPQGQATKGTLTRQQQWVGDTTYIDSVRNEYDSYGNIITQLDANGSRRSMGWDPILNSFPVREDIEVGDTSSELTIIAAYNPGLGVAISNLDFNENETTYHHDSFGRLTAIVVPEDSPELPSQSFVYQMADPAAGVSYSYNPLGNVSRDESSTILTSSVSTRTREVSGQSGTLDTTTHVDGLGRTLATITEGEGNFIVNSGVLFNNQGLARYSFLPYESGSIEYAPPVLNGSVLENRYDALGRLVEQINPPGDDSLVTSTLTQFYPLYDRSINENNVGKNIYRDGLGRIIQVQEENLGENYITSYGYDTLGNLTRITDAQNNVKTMTYDALGRKTVMEDPDKGHMEYDYDSSSNLTRASDNKDQEILYRYDKANRLLTIDYLDAADLTPDISYHYDIPSPDYPEATNLSGKTSWVEDLSGTTFLSYDTRGNNDWIINRIDDRGSVSDYLSRSEYDAMGRVSSFIFPDGDRLTYRYDNRGLLESIPGYVENIDYFVAGQRAALELSNNVTTSYGYDPRQRLNLLQSTNTLAGSLLQDLSYTFDGAGSITTITDNRTLALDSPKNGTQHFEYDDLHRLTRAEGGGYGTISFQYDKIGNMIFKGSPGLPDQTHIDDPLINLGAISSGGTAGTSDRGPGLTGGQPGPHAATSTESGLLYEYDNNGNMISRGSGDVYEWDFSDRLVQATTAESVSTFVYDAAGSRKIKNTVENSVETTDYYINNNYEIRDGTPVKYVFDGTRRVARVQQGQSATGSESIEQRFELEVGWNYIGLNVEPDDSAIGTVLSPIDGSYSEVWHFESSTQQYQGYVPGEGITDLTELHGGHAYIIKISAPEILVINGTRVTPDQSLSTGWNLVPCPSEAPIGLEKAVESLGGSLEAIWEYNTDNDNWSSYNSGQPDFLQTLETLTPGKAYWIKVSTPANLIFQPQQVHFYHTDHLGSSSLVTDSSGVAVEETAFYPFGRPRYEERSGFDSAYKYTGKELDRATGLMYYETRYYDPVLSQFTSVDPLYVEDNNNVVPQLGNLYSYTINNPVNMRDPMGLEPVKSNLEVVLGDPEALKLVQTYAAASSDTIVVSGDGTLRPKFNKNATAKERAEKQVGTDVVRELALGVSNKTIVRSTPLGMDSSATPIGDQGMSKAISSKLGGSDAQIVLGLTSVPIERDMAQGFLYPDKVEPVGTLIHESIHAEHITKGEAIDPNIVIPVMMKDPNNNYQTTYQMMPLEEWVTIGFGNQSSDSRTENEHHRDQGNDIRGSY